MEQLVVNWKQQRYYSDAIKERLQSSRFNDKNAFRKKK